MTILFNNRSINQSIYQSINQSINQSVSRSDSGRKWTDRLQLAVSEQIGYSSNGHSSVSHERQYVVTIDWVETHTLQLSAGTTPTS